MLGLFETILNLSLIGSIVILLIIIVRHLLRRIPTKYIYGLWALAAFRLLCPKSPSSVLSLFNLLPKKKISVSSSEGAIDRISAAPTSSGKVTGNVIQQVVRPVSSAGKAPGSSLPDIWQVLMIIWVIGMAALAIAILYKSITIYRSLRDTRMIEDNVYSGPSVPSPFVLGVLRPRIYMPLGLPDKEYRYLLKHEQTHLRRKDMLFKFFFITALIVHWFNPLVWIAYRLFESDMEMSCDEEVIKHIGSDLRADYCMSLVSYARESHSPKYLVSLLGFGKENVKARIKNVMNYKKLSLWLSMISIVAVASIFVCGFLSPVEGKDPENKSSASNESTSASENARSEETTETTSGSIATDETDPSTLYIYTDEPLWGTAEWIELHKYNPVSEGPDVSLPEGALFDLDLPRPDKDILIDCEVEEGAVFSSDTLGDFTSSYVVPGEANPSDLIFIVTEEMSESELSAYIEDLQESGFIDLTHGNHLYIGHTAEGCYVIIEYYGDIDKYTTIRYSSSYTTEDDTMGVG